MPAKKTFITAAKKPFPVIGIGGTLSNGSDAFKLFIKSIPEKSGMAYLFLQHPGNAYEDSSLRDILEKASPLPVQLITNDVRILPDHIYVVPSGKMIIAEDDVLKLKPLRKHTNMLDRFFSALATVHHGFAAAVILSGPLSEGVRGLQAIKSYGGLTFAHDDTYIPPGNLTKRSLRPETVDFVLSPGIIIQKLISINQSFYADGQQDNDSLDEEIREEEEIFRQLIGLLRIRRGVDFTNYKQSTLKRRIIRRMALAKMDSPADYLRFLYENKNEQDALYNDMLISVTDFFRDPKSYDLLCNVVFPSIVGQKTANEPIRIWVVGCATGEEAYSMAICLEEYLGDKIHTRKIQIFATDVSETAIAKARSGIYRPTDMEGVSSHQLQKFFSKIDGNFQVNKSIRDLCVFAHHNVLKDPPFLNMDLVSCRNVLIYLEPVLQKRALHTFHYALNEKGYLMLGKSETTGTAAELFTPYNQHEKIYQSKGAHGSFRHILSSKNEQVFLQMDRSMQDKNNERDLTKIADDLLLNKFSPAGVMVNQAFDIIQFRGKTDSWLTQSPGKPSFNILKMAREGLSFEIRNLLLLAKTRQLPARKEGIFFKVDDKQRYVNIEVLPLPGVQEDYFLVLFQDSVVEAIVFRSDSDPSSSHAKKQMNVWVQRIEQLEKELLQTREDMRAITEVQEAANEELQSANEELLSGSEELRSLNEELETSKEELQSTNEEIMIINNELLNRNEQLNNARQYTEGIFGTIQEPLLILDSNLTVQRATDGFYEMFNVDEEDVQGKNFYEMGGQQWDIAALRVQLEQVLPQRGSFKAFEMEHTFNKTGRRVIQLSGRTVNTLVNEKLTLLAIGDITDTRKVEAGLAEAERLLAENKERLQIALESANIGTWDFDPGSGELFCDVRCRDLIAIKRNDPINYPVFLDLLHPDDRPGTEEALKNALGKMDGGNFDHIFRLYNRPEQGIRWLRLKGKAYFDDRNKPFRLIGTLLDISKEKMVEEKTNELLKRKDEFLNIASHELKTPITIIKGTVQLLERTITNEGKYEPLRTLISKARKQTDKLISLISDLLDVTRIQSGRVTLNKTDFPLFPLINECCELILDKPHRCKINIDGSRGLLVHADRNRVEQVLINLLNNAVKYGPDSDTIDIQIIQSNKTVKILVKDYGSGISKDQIPLLFDRFFRIEDDNRHVTGLGLGLYIAADIIKRHGGDIGAESELGKGSVFWFTLPLSLPA